MFVKDHSHSGVPLLHGKEDCSNHHHLDPRLVEATLEKVAIAQPSESYDPFKTPPDIDKAIKHGKATRTSVIRKKVTEVEVCECCGLPIENELIPLSGVEAGNQLAEIGVAYSLYFEFIKVAGALLVVFYIIFGQYAAIANLSGTFCDEHEAKGEDDGCAGGFIIGSSNANRGEKESYGWFGILTFISTIIGLIIGIWYKRMHHIKADEVEEAAITPSDFTVMIRGLPKGESVEDVKAFFEANGRNNGQVTVKRVFMVYDVKPYIEFMADKEKIESKLNAKEGDKAELTQELSEVDFKLQLYREHNSSTNSPYFLGTAFVTFDSPQETKAVLDKFQFYWFQYVIYLIMKGRLEKWWCWKNKNYKDSLIVMERAPEPTDILWENLNVGRMNKIKSRSLTAILGIVVIILSAWISKALEHAINIKRLGETTLADWFLYFLSSLVIILFNMLIESIVEKLSNYEKHKTYTHKYVSTTERLIWLQVVNTVYSLGLHEKRDEQLWSRDSDIYDLYLLMILNAIIPPLTKYYSPSYLWQTHKRKKLIADPQGSKLNQQEGNQLMEEPEFDICQSYSQIQVTIMVTAIYAGVLPIIIFISMIGLCLNYVVDKYLLLRRSSRPKAIGRDLSEAMIPYLNLTTFLFAANNLKSLGSKHDVSNVFEGLTLISIFVSIIVILLPQDTIIKLLHKDKIGQAEALPFDEAKLQFVTDYDRENPVTKDDAINEWIQTSQSNLSLYESYMMQNADENA